MLAKQAMDRSHIDSTLDRIFEDTSDTLFDQFSIEKKIMVLNTIKEAVAHIEKIRHNIQIFLNQPTDDKSMVEFKNIINDAYKEISSDHAALENIAEKISSSNERDIAFNENVFNQEISEIMQYAKDINWLIEGYLPKKTIDE